MNKLDFLVIAPTPFYANRGCHMRIRGEAEALQKKGRKVLILTYKEGENVPGLKIIRSPIGMGFGQGVAATWKNIPAGFFLFWSVLYETLYQRPKIIYGHLFEGAAIGIAVKYLAIFLSLFHYNPVLVLDAQGSLSEEMMSYGMVKNPVLLKLVQWLEKFILFFSDYVFASSVQCAESLKKVRPGSRPIVLYDGVSIFRKSISLESISKFREKNDKEKALSKISAYFSSPQISLIQEWIKNNNLILLYTGSYSFAKGFPAFAEKSLPELLKNPNIRFLFGGGKSASIPDLDKLISDNPDKIMSVSDLNLKNLPYFLLLGDIAIDCKPPKTSESSGKILNYMAMGLPVVCFDQKNNKLFLKEGGFFARDYAEFTEGIIKLSGNSNLIIEMGNKNLKRAWNEFTWDKTADKILETVLNHESRITNHE